MASRWKTKILFYGSANYTQTAFNEKLQLETLTSCKAKEAYEYFSNLIDDSIYCTHPESEELITIYNDRYDRKIKTLDKNKENNKIFPSNIETLKVSMFHYWIKVTKFI